MLPEFPTSAVSISKPHATQGFTLTETMLALLVCTVSVLGLLSTQMHALADLREAESRQAVSRAAANLAAAMSVSSTFTQESDRRQTVRHRRYPDYYRQNQIPSAQSSGFQAASSVNSAEWARRHLVAFEQALTQVPHAENVRYSICREQPENKTPSNKNDLSCRPSNRHSDISIIKIGWQTASRHYRYQLDLGN